MGLFLALQVQAQYDSIPTHLVRWQYQPETSWQQFAPPDTLMGKLDRFHPVDKQHRFNYFNGNYGFASLSMVFHERPHYSEYLLNRHFAPYLQQAAESYFYNTNKPYTHIKYTTSTRERNKQTMDVKHSQNVNPALNLTFRLGGHRSEGAYTNQLASGRYFGASINYNRPNYLLHAAWLQQTMEHEENAGFTLDDTDPEDVILAPNLEEAANALFNQTGMLAQTLKIGDTRNQPDSVKVGIAHSIIDISHVFEYQRQSFLFERTIDPANTFYSTIFYDSLASYDSTFYSQFANSLFLNFRDQWNRFFPIGLSLGITQENTQYYNFRDPLLANTTQTYANRRASIQLFNQSGQKLQWNARLGYYFSGFRQDDIRIKGHMHTHFALGSDTLHIRASGAFTDYGPDYFSEQYYANHIRWDESLQRIKHLQLAGSLYMPRWQSRVSVHINQVNNHLYFDTTATPVQSKQALQVLAVRFKQNLNWWHLHWNNELVYQLASSEELLPVPNWMYKGSFYFQGKLYDVLNTQIGVNVAYQSAYKIPAYYATTGQYYQNPEEEYAGQVPLLSGFINMHWKRAQLFFKFNYLNEVWAAENDYYYTVKAYPNPPMTFTFGVSWWFHN